jgi:hypothetical protein
MEKERRERSNRVKTTKGHKKGEKKKAIMTTKAWKDKNRKRHKMGRMEGE